MNAFRLATIGLCAIALLPVETSQAWLATAASTLFESTPFILAAYGLAAAFARHGARWAAYLGCGCSGGPSARSLPGAVATALVFGPAVSAGRLIAATLAARVARPGGCGHRAGPLDDLRQLFPVAAASAAAAPLLAHVPWKALPPAAALAAGAIAGFALAPCALGAVASAAALRHASTWATAGFLCVAGIADGRTWLARKRAATAAAHDGAGYACAAVACAIVAAHRGAGLVHPHFTLPLWSCGAALGVLALRFRNARDGASRVVPGLLLAAALLRAPEPTYAATETTLANAFAGESVSFVGTVQRDRGTTSVVRYAITCCRADASPVAVVLEREISYRGWVRVVGKLANGPSGLRLRLSSIRAVDRPPDPFVYR